VDAASKRWRSLGWLAHRTVPELFFAFLFVDETAEAELFMARSSQGTLKMTASDTTAKPRSMQLRSLMHALGCAAAIGALSLPLLTGTTTAAKDTGPMLASCDVITKQSPQWRACAAAAVEAASLGATSGEADKALFYAGYWLAKSGSYAQALGYLGAIRSRDEKALTYIGFASRKLGGIGTALEHYRQALDINPDYVVARAYLGEAYLQLGRPDDARKELGEIERRCGASCKAYAELAAEIADYQAG